MKKFCSFAIVIALAMTMALAVHAFVASTPPAKQTDITDTDNEIMPQISLFKDMAYSRHGQWTSSKFTATSSNGNYIRYWHKNDTGEAVKVYLYRTDSGEEVLVSSMKIGDNSQDSKVYYDKTAGSGTYEIIVEAYVSGGLITGNVAVSQCKTDSSI